MILEKILSLDKQKRNEVLKDCNRQFLDLWEAMEKRDWASIGSALEYLRRRASIAMENLDT